VQAIIGLTVTIVSIRRGFWWAGMAIIYTAIMIALFLRGARGRRARAVEKERAAKQWASGSAPPLGQ
jgi:hypothetical protein